MLAQGLLLWVLELLLAGRVLLVSQGLLLWGLELLPVPRLLLLAQGLLAQVLVLEFRTQYPDIDLTSILGFSSKLAS